MAAPIGACVDAGSDAAENRLTSFKDDAGNTSTWAYDPLNRMTSAEDIDHEVEFTRPVIGLLSMPYEETQRYTSGSAYSKTVTKGYDSRGLVTSEAYPSGASLTLTRAYNDLGAPSSVTDVESPLDPANRVGFRVEEGIGRDGGGHVGFGLGFKFLLAPPPPPGSTGNGT